MFVFAEELVFSQHKDAEGSWENDYDHCVPHFTEIEQPCYILYRCCIVLYFISIDGRIEGFLYKVLYFDPVFNPFTHLG